MNEWERMGGIPGQFPRTLYVLSGAVLKCDQNETRILFHSTRFDSLSARLFCYATPNAASNQATPTYRWERLLPFECEDNKHLQLKLCSTYNIIPTQIWSEQSKAKHSFFLIATLSVTFEWVAWYEWQGRKCFSVIDRYLKLHLFSGGLKKSPPESFLTGIKVISLNFRWKVKCF